MKAKGDIAVDFKIFRATVKRHLGEKIMRSRCDNGKADYDVKDNAVSTGRVFKKGKEMTSKRTIMGKGRTTLLEANLPESFWAETVNMAVYLHKGRHHTRHGIIPRHDGYSCVPDKKRTSLQSKIRECLFMSCVTNTTKMWKPLKCR